MYVYEEHVCDDTIKKCLKQTHADVVEGRSGQTEHTPSLGGSVSLMTKMIQSDQEAPASNSEGLRATTGRSPSQGLICIAHKASFNIQQQYSPITIKEILDYSHAEAWLGSFYETAIQCLYDDLELYQLLDLDADGIDDPDFSQAEEILVV
ncbi:hypothetical protein PAXRUDRAFT_144328 [Paxillus rubicundulus Ve08.2h10]|uniref:Uncharacterized protein n=1 Tax=Paxillus rubicundulus Ve08.2h10 TaxID=930991 RepID=A0A0D0E118_9AGAM|nr:hypothetical protein PAXRUDRAFT_144328 [Paxillus rubicundulus Ve08.2h10]